MCLWFAKPLNTGTHKQCNRTTAAVAYNNYIRPCRDIIWVICTEDFQWRLHADMHRRLTSTMLLPSYTALLIAGVSLDSANDKPSREAYQRYHCKKQNSRFFSHVNMNLVL